jgi:hypothetical protein
LIACVTGSRRSIVWVVEMAESRFSWDFVTGVSSLLFGVDVVDKDVVWAAGQDKAAVVLTVDRGRSWMDVTPPGIVDALQFHDVEAFDQRRALVLAVGQGPLSKISGLPMVARHGGWCLTILKSWLSTTASRSLTRAEV